MLSDFLSSFANRFAVQNASARCGARGRRSSRVLRHRIEPAESRCLLSGASPMLVSITPITPLPAGETIDFEVRFSEPVTGLSPGNFVVISASDESHLPLNGAFVDSISSIPGRPEVWKVHVNFRNALPGPGTATLLFSDFYSGVRDADGNAVYSAGDEGRLMLNDGWRAGAGVSVVSDDFDGDGIADIASCHPVGFRDFGTDYIPNSLFEGRVSGYALKFLFGQADGTFKSGGAALSDGAQWIRPVKLYADGSADLAVGLRQYTDDGETHDAIQLIDIGPSGNTAVSGLIPLQSNEMLLTAQFEDLNGDGLSEIITFWDPSEQDQLGCRVRWNDGFGGYSNVTESAFLRQGISIDEIQFVNVTGDELPEIVLGKYALNVLEIRQTSGTFAMESVAYYPSVESAGEIQLSDLTGDGLIDMVYATWGYGSEGTGISSFHVREGLPAGLFGESRPITDLEGNPLAVDRGAVYAARHFVCDVNQDGRADVLCETAHFGADGFLWLQGHANGRFSVNLLPGFSARHGDQYRERPSSSAAGPGLIFYNRSYDYVWNDVLSTDIVRVNFAPEPGVQTENREGTWLESFQYHDVNGDGTLEELSWGSEGQPVERYGRWPREMEFFLEVNGRAPRTVDSGDVAAIGFGRLRGTLGTSEDSRLVVADNSKSTVRLYQGSGQGLPAGVLTRQVTAEYALTGPPVDLLVSDLDLNGTLDLATANSTASGAVSILLGSGGTLNPAEGIDLPAGASALTLADLNNDGVGDLLVAGTDGQVRLLSGNGNGSFQQAITVFQSAVISALHVTDLSGDGVPDLIVENQSTGRLTFGQGTGGGAFVPRGDIQSAGGLQVSRVADVNRDGLADLVIGTAEGNIRIYYGKSASVLDPPNLLSTQIDLPETGIVRDLQVEDLTGDDRPEIAVLQATLEGNFPGSLVAVFVHPVLENGNWQLWSEKRGDFQHLFIDELGTDGRPDLLLASRSGMDFGFFQNTHLPLLKGVEAPFYTSFYPTLDWLNPVTMLEDANQSRVYLRGISAGGHERQPLRVSAVSSQTSILEIPEVFFDGVNFAYLELKPVRMAAGVVQVTVTVEDAGLDADFSTIDDNRLIWRTFDVTIVPQRPRVTVPPAPIKAPLTLNWTAVPDAVSYRVFIRNYSLGLNPIVLAETTQTSWTSATDLPMGRCEVWVQAVNWYGMRLPWSLGHKFSVVTPPVSAAIPSRLADPLHEFSWTAVPGATEYRVWVTFASGGLNPLVQQKVTGLKWRPSEPLPVGNHTFWVQAIAPDATTSAWSVPVSFLVATSPQQLSPLASVFDTTPLFQWQSVVGASSYGFFLRNAQTGAVVANVSGINGLSWEPAVALTPGDYRWWVIAETSFNGLRGNWSPAITFYVGGRAEIIGPLPNAVTSPLPVISWKRIDDAVSYRVWITQISPVNRVVVNVSGLTSNSYQVSQLLSAGSFRVWVQAVTAGAVAGPWSLPVNFTVPLLTAVDSIPSTLRLDLHPLRRDTGTEREPVTLVSGSAQLAENQRSHRMVAAPAIELRSNSVRPLEPEVPEALSDDDSLEDMWTHVLDHLLLAAAPDSQNFQQWQSDLRFRQ